jgi:hypothetical protein
MDLEDIGGLLVLAGLAILLCGGDPSQSWRWAIAAGCILLGALLVVLDRLTRNRGIQ